MSEDVGERSPARCETREKDRRRAAVLLTITSVLWLHQWAPLIFVAGFVVWVLLHERLEGELGQRLARLWRRGWPPATVVLVPLLAAGTLAYWAVDVPLTAKVVPIAVNVLALSLLACGSGWRLFAAWRMSPRTRAVMKITGTDTP